MSDIRHYIFLLSGMLLATACSTDDMVSEPENHEFTLTSEVIPFKGESETRGNLDGTGFGDGDRIRLKIICPFVDSSEYGESTWGNSFDAFFLLKRNGDGWSYLTASDHCDINGTYSYSGSPQVGSFYEAQQTPYVYMASTWTEEKSFRTGNNGSIHVLQYSHVFHADQRKIEKYKASDLLWAQQYMQTGSWNVHLSFEHKMACITFEVVGATLSDNAILTLEGMPDIDQQEVLVGDYYAARSKINSRCGYKEKNCCSFGNNGKVIGIGVNLDNETSTLDSNKGRARCYPMTGNPETAAATVATDKVVSNTGTYTAYKMPGGNQNYRMIVPPCVLGQNAQIWVRDGESRYKMTLGRKDFHEGELYPVKVTLKNE